MARPPAPKLAEVLAEIRMSPSAFYRMRARGQEPCMGKLPNGELRCRRADLDAWWENCEREPRSAQAFYGPVDGQWA
ncbi:helix-turn-helix transcriptional regulator [Streptomyces noursei]|uniref:helix-turn-helix transcriptional regulator n=1 Tax=Streptomyces noursei TaxID=1971 RepID=UPI000C9A5B3B|nr:DNA-binding protein [Streptomyces noursei]